MLIKKKLFLPLILLAGLIVIGSFSYNLYQILLSEQTCDKSPRLTSKLGGEIELTDQNGEMFKLSTQDGKLSLIYFGYSFCPDICPYDLERNAYVKDLMDGLGNNINLIFITLDPKRDTAERLKLFSEYIHPDLISLTGSEKEIEVIKDIFKVFGSSNEKDKDDLNYLVDHSTFSYLTDKNGKVLTFFNRRATPEEISEKMMCFL
jgi:protein SCO1/2